MTEAPSVWESVSAHASVFSISSDASLRCCFCYACWLFRACFAQQLLQDDSPEAAVTHDKIYLKKKKPKTKVERADARSQIKGVCAGGSGYLRRAKLQTMAHTGTAQSSRALLCALLLLLSSITGAQVLVTDSEEELSPRALRDFYPKGPNLTSEKQLVRFAPGTSE